MIAIVRPRRTVSSAPAWHAGFLRMLPRILRHARVTFRRMRSEARADAIQEVLANATVAYARLAELGKTDVAYPTVLARYAVAQFRDGRRVGNRLNIRDVLSPYARRKKRFAVKSLHDLDPVGGRWIDATLVDDHTPPADQAAFRCDFPAWLATHTRRNRRIAHALAMGYTTGDVARRFHLSPGRISQLRWMFFRSWQRFHGEPPEDAPAGRKT